MLNNEILSRYSRRELMMSYKAACMALTKANNRGTGNDKTRAMKRVRIHTDFFKMNEISF